MDKALKDKYVYILFVIDQNILFNKGNFGKYYKETAVQFQSSYFQRIRNVFELRRAVGSVVYEPLLKIDEKSDFFIYSTLLKIKGGIKSR
ncbi:MAG: hypothetical protein NT065_05845 [Chlamydiae bacterium]|nr:hypothetical protein [Chlamydiota bacterium]